MPDQIMQTPPGGNIYENAEGMSRIESQNLQNQLTKARIPTESQRFQQELQNSQLQAQLLQTQIQSVKERAPIEGKLLQAELKGRNLSNQLQEGQMETKLSQGQTELQQMQETAKQLHLQNKAFIDLEPIQLGSAQSEADILKTKAQYAGSESFNADAIAKEQLDLMKKKGQEQGISTEILTQQLGAIKDQLYLGVQQGIATLDQTKEKTKSLAAERDALTAQLGPAIAGKTGELIAGFRNMSPTDQEALLPQYAAIKGPTGDAFKLIQADPGTFFKQLEAWLAGGTPKGLDPELFGQQAISYQIALKMKGLQSQYPEMNMDTMASNLQKSLTPMASQIAKNQAQQRPTPQNPPSPLQTQVQPQPQGPQQGQGGPGSPGTPAPQGQGGPGSSQTSTQSFQVNNDQLMKQFQDPAAKPFIDAMQIKATTPENGQLYKGLLSQLAQAHSQGQDPTQVLQAFSDQYGKGSKIFTPEQMKAIASLPGVK